MVYRSFSLIPTLNDNLLSDRFSQIDQLFSRLTGEKPVIDIPAYDLIQKNQREYELTISVPGYEKNELDISVLNNNLTITGKQNTNIKKQEIEKYLHKGISKKNFSLSFTLDHRIIIQSANLNKGLLILQLIYNIPEEEKATKVTINNSQENNKIINHKI